jgi:hypothetical protein
MYAFQIAPAIPDMDALRADAQRILNESALAKRAEEKRFPFPPAPAADPLTAQLANPDALDSELLDSVYGVEVSFVWGGCPGVYGRQQMSGVIVGIETQRGGSRRVEVKTATLNLPVWVDVQKVQFTGKRVCR